jgi:hypothetical protein
LRGQRPDFNSFAKAQDVESGSISFYKTSSYCTGGTLSEDFGR